MGACQDLAEMSAKGEDAPPHPQRAIELYKLACDHDSPTACMAWALAIKKARRAGGGRFGITSRSIDWPHGAGVEDGGIPGVARFCLTTLHAARQLLIIDVRRGI